MVAQGQLIDLVSPGFRGLNLNQAGSLLGPEYCLKADNALIDASGRLAARAGYTDNTTTDITANAEVRTIFEYRTGTGGTETIVAWNGGIANDITDPETNDISGAVTDADGNWWFQNFNEKVIGFQDGQKPIVYTGTGSFATVVESAGTAPTSDGGVGLCAFGRVWALDSDGQTIKYSALLDETDWLEANGAGLIDMSNVWTNGMDQVRAITAFNGSLVVFGDNHIVFWVDGQGSALGLDPLQIYVVDVIEGTGCLSQWSIQHIGDSDLVFLSRNGVQSLARVVQEKSNPLTNLSKYVRNTIIDTFGSLSPELIRSTYSPEEGFYLLTSPGVTTWCMDYRYRYQDEQGEAVGVWTKWDLAPYAWSTHRNGTIYLGGSWGVGTYGGVDDAGSTFRIIYESPWLDLGENLANRLKILKRLSTISFVRNETTLVYKWWTDFERSAQSLTKVLTGSDAVSEFGSAEWGIDEFGGSLALRIIRLPARGKGQYYKVGLEADISGSFAIQQIELFAKIGRLA